MRKTLSVILAVLLLIGSIPLSLIFVSAEDTDNLAANYTHANGSVTIDEKLVEINADDDTGISAHGGYGWAIPRHNQNASVSPFDVSFVVHTTGLKADTYYQFGFSNGGTCAIEVTSIASADGSENLEFEPEIRVHPVSDPNNIPTNYGTLDWDDVTVGFTTGAAADYDITLKVKPNPNHVRANVDTSKQYYVFSDLVLRESQKAPEVSSNLAENYTWSNGDVTLGDGLVGFYLRDDKPISAHGGYGWALPRYAENRDRTPYNAYFEIHATGLQPDTCYQFGFSNSGNYIIRVASVVPANGGDALTLASQTRTAVEDPLNTDASLGINISMDTWDDVLVEFTTNSTDTDYTIRLEVPGQGETIARSGVDGDAHYIFSDLSLMVAPEIDPNLAANYTHANGDVEWEALVGTTRVDDTAASAHGGYGWVLPRYAENKNVSPFNAAFIIHATGLKTDTHYQFGYSNGGAYAIEVASIAPANGGAALEVGAETRTAVDEPLNTDPSVGMNTWDDVTVDFTTNGTDTAYDITLKLKPEPNHARANRGDGDAHYIFSDLTLTEVIEIDPNIASGYTNANGKVTWISDLVEASKNDETDFTAHGGYGWAWPRHSENKALSPFDAYFTIHATDLKPGSLYQFGFSNGGTLAIEVTSIVPAKGGAAIDFGEEKRTPVTDPLHVPAEYGTVDWDDVLINFLTNETDTDYDITLKVKSPSPNHVRPNIIMDAQYYVFSDLILREVSDILTVDTAVVGGGSARVAESEVIYGDQATLVAEPHLLEEFLGWFDENGQFLSNSLVYQPTVLDNATFTAKFTTFTTSASNLIRPFKLNGGITVTYTGWNEEISGTDTRYEGYGLKISDEDFDSDTHGVEIKVTGLKPNTAYRFAFANGSDHRLGLEKVVSAKGVEADIMNALAIPDGKWLGMTYTFLTGDETDYTLTIAADGRSKSGSQRGDGFSWSDAIISDFALIERDVINNYNFAQDWTNANGAVTWYAGITDITNKDDTSISAHGGYGWRMPRHGGNVNTHPFNDATFTVHATGLTPNSKYRFGFSNSSANEIEVTSITAVESGNSITFGDQTRTMVTDPKNLYPGEGIDVWFDVETTFTTNSTDTVYDITFRPVRVSPYVDYDHIYYVFSDITLIRVVEPNLAEDYSVKNGQITWTDNSGVYDDAIDQHQGLEGGYSWKFGLNDTNNSSNVANVTIKAAGLERNTTYVFSYIYTKDYQILVDSIKDSDGDLTASNPASYTLLDDKTYRGSVTFTTSISGDYTITLKMGKGWNNEPCDNDYVILSDLSLIKQLGKTTINLAENFTNASGEVTWTDNSGVNAGSVDQHDGINGGYSWKFDCADTAANDGIITIKAAALKANSLYSFSYIYSGDYRIEFNSLTDPAGNNVKIENMLDTELEEGDRAHKVSFWFTTNASGEYTITLKTGKRYPNTDCQNQYVLLSDLVLTMIYPEIIEADSKVQYAGWMYNLLDNENFEQEITDEDWKDLPGSVQIMTGDAAYNDNYLRANVGTFYILPVEVKVGTNYYFAATVRGSASTDGFIGISATANGTGWYADAKDQPRSQIHPLPGSTDWTRNAFLFRPDSDMVYLVISCTTGIFDVDNIMLFEEQYGEQNDPNDYKDYSYDFAATDSDTCVDDGGFVNGVPFFMLDSSDISGSGSGSSSGSNSGSSSGSNSGSNTGSADTDDGQNGEEDYSGSEAPETGDSLVAPVICILVSLLAAGAMYTLLFMKKKRTAGGLSK